MTNDDLLVMLKSDLEIITDYMDAEAKAAEDAELMTYIETAKTFITREGITLSLSDMSDCMLITMYAAWLYRKRKDSTTNYQIIGMPRMLRYNLNNRLFQEKLNGNG